MAEHLFYVQQGSNVDTANLNDGFLVFQKNMQLEIAKNNTIISSVEDLMDKSFIGKTHTTMNDVRDVLSEFLISDKNTNKSGSTTTRQVLEATLMPYIGLPARDFVAVARKAVNALFDWAVRTQPNSINNSLKAALVGKESYVNQTMEFISSIKNNPEHPLYDNAVINSISLVGNDKSDIENLQIKGKDNKIFDQNSLIYGFREIKEFARDIKKISLYGNIIRVAILQSGLENSKISFTSLIPYEDFQQIYKETLSNLENMPNLADFYNGGILERSQWNNTDVVGAKVSVLKKNKFDKWYTDYGLSQQNIPESVKNQISKKEIPPILEIPMLSREARKDFIKYTWEDPNIKAAQKAEMRKQGDFSYRHTVLLKKVYMAPGEPLINYGKKGNFPKYVYKAVHALGDSFRATEALPVSYGTFNGTQAAPTRGNAIMQASVLDNGFDKDFTETTDDVITNAYLGDYSQENNVPLPSMQQAQPSTSVKPTVKDLSRWADIKDTTDPYTDKGIVVTRISNTTDHFGNPFIGSKRRDKQGNLVESKVDNITVFNTIDEADQAYRDWLSGTKHQNIQSLRREWILKQINEGKLDGKTLLYYKPMEVTNNDGTIVRGGYHSHADTLAEIVEELRGTQPSPSVKIISEDYGFNQAGVLTYTNKELDDLFLSLRDKYNIPSIPKTKEETRLFRLKNALLLTKNADTNEYIKIPDLSDIFTNTKALNLYKQYLNNINNSRDLFIERFKNDSLFNQEIEFRPGEIKKGYEFIPKTTKSLIDQPSILFLELFKNAGLKPGTDAYKAKLLDLKQFIDSKTTVLLNNAIKLELGITTTQPSTSVEIVSRYTDTDVKANPNKIYVFGDNTQRTGTGGQAQIRNNPNAMGIATKLAPSMDESAFMNDKDLVKNKAVIDGDIAKIKATGKAIVMPKDGLGTGLAKLKEKAPQTYAYLKQRLLEEFGFDNDKGTISQPTQSVSKQSNVDKKIKPEGLPEIKQQNKNNCR
jgi:hypothetical protein